MPWNADASSDSDVERVRGASDIVTVIARYLKLDARGREFVGLCPFHDDRKPSMTVSPAKQIFKCFACGAGGDVFSFVQQYHGVDFPGAIEMLAQDAGIELTPRRQRRPDAPQGGHGVSRRDLLGANAQACGFFQTLLAHPEHGRAARAVIEQRGISPEMVEQFRIGTSPDRYDGLLMTVGKRGWSEPAFAAAGLLKDRESGGRYDAFRHRLIFPISDQGGNVIAFGGRRLNDEDNPKYLNSPESSLFSKSKQMYGLFQATRAIKQTGRAVVVEGYTDVIACHQRGFRNVVGTLGTALTADHARVLRRLSREVVLLFDGDQAGMKAAERAVEVFFAESIDVRIATLSSVTDAKDPDETLALPDGEALFREAIDVAEDLLGFLFRSVEAEMRSGGPAARARVVQDFVDRLSRLGLDRVAPMQRSLIHRRLAELTGTDWDTVRTVLGAARPGPRAERGDADAGGTDHRARDAALSAREELLGCLLADASVAERLGASDADALDAVLDAARYADRVLGELVGVIDSIRRAGGSIGLHPVLDALSRADEARGGEPIEAGEIDGMGGGPGAHDVLRSAKSAAVRLSERASESVEDDRERLLAKAEDCVRRLRWERPERGTRGDGAGPGDDPHEAEDGSVSVVSRLHALQAKHRELGKNPVGLPRVDRP